MADTDSTPTTGDPSPEDIARVQQFLAQQKLATGNPQQVALGTLVIGTAFRNCYDEMLDAQRKVPGNTELNYAISMMTRLTETYTPR